MPKQPENHTSRSVQRNDSTSDRQRDGRVSAGSRLDFFVVAIGASAGGLEALKELFDHTPADTGMAFVVLTHQHPDHTSLLPELLGRETEMPVVEAVDETKLQPNRVYVAPPGEHLAILGGTLHLKHRTWEESPKLPVDSFFRSLAEDQKDRAIGIVLSGTGTDGTIGLKAIKAESGMAMAQKPRSASFAGMPSSAIATGLVDYVLPPAEMPDHLVAYARGPYWQHAQRAERAPSVPEPPLQKVFRLLRRRTGHDFSGYKTSTIRRRIHRRMNVHQIDDPAVYARYLEGNDQEIDILLKELLISVTSFFRDPEAWDTLAAGPLPELLQSRSEGDTLRAWIPGCATGEEAYSLAILLHECMDQIDRHLDVQIFATDLDSAAIETARQGRYAHGIAADLTPRRLERFLHCEDECFRVCTEIREMVIFATQNLIKDPPFTKLDLLCCRNVLIYLDAELQQRLLPILHYSLRPGGLLFLGPSETIGSFNDIFKTLCKRWKIFRRQETATPRPLEIPIAPLIAGGEAEEQTGETSASHHNRPSSKGSTRRSVERLIERLMLARFCPPTIAINDRGDIIHVHGRTGQYLEPAEGQPRMNAFDMAREGLRTALASAVRQAVTEDQDVVRENVRVKVNGGQAHVDLTVTKLHDPETIRGLLLVSFRPVPASATAESPEKPSPQGPEKPSRQNDEQDDRVAELEREIQYLQESHHTTQEELKTANEELKSTNEELQSTNEELQSTNEELETSKEELQSLNEELTTVNTELQSKVEELAHANDDMQNLLNSTDVATLFLDTELKIKRYTEQAKNLIKLRPSDVGRPIQELATNLQSDHWVNDCRDVLKTLVSKQQEVVSTEGVWYMMRIMPYRTAHNVIDGLVVTLVNIDELKRAKQLAELRTYFENIFDTVRHPLLVLDEQLHVVSVNRRFCETFRVRSETVQGKLIYETGEQQWDLPELRELLEEVMARDAKFEDFGVEDEFPNLGRRRFALNARRVQQASGLPGMILLGMQEITDQRSEDVR